jgi:hypothetical protein
MHVMRNEHDLKVWDRIGLVKRRVMSGNDFPLSIAPVSTR